MSTGSYELLQNARTGNDIAAALAASAAAAFDAVDTRGVGHVAASEAQLGVLAY